MAGGELSWHDRASTRLLGARKNGRLRNKKVRSGCVTCKARKVKCDEQKPQCRRCLATGRHCEGYSPSPSSSTTPERDQTYGHISIASPPAQFLDLSDRSKRKLDFFVSKAGPQLAGGLDQDFWCSSALQVGHQETFAMDSILAISTLYEHPQFLASFYSNPRGRLNSPDGPPLNEHHSEALVYYNRAIKSFKQSVIEGRATPLLALMSCSLFLCIELIRDNVYAALELYKRGAQLLRQFRESIREDQDSSLLGTIRLMFARMSALAPAFSSYDMNKAILDNDADPNSVKVVSMTEARNELFALMIESDRFVRDTNTWMTSLVASRTSSNATRDPASDLDEDASAVETMYGVVFRMTLEPQIQTATVPPPSSMADTPLTALESDAHCSTEVLHPDRSPHHNAHTLPTHHVYGCDDSLTTLLQRQMELLHRLDVWRKALNGMTREGQIPQQQTIDYLMMLYHATFLWLSTRLNPLETHFDTFKTHFQELLHHAELYLDSLSSPAPTFTFEIGATPALFLAAIKCRVPSLRRRALALMLKAPKKECMHGSFSTAEFARGIIELEEADSGLPKIELNLSQLANAVDDSIFIPERHRIHHPELLHNISKGEYELKGQRHFEVDGFIYVDVLVAPL